jgi:hypothetical protein
LRNLGSQLIPWLERKSNAGLVPTGIRELAFDMARLEWAHIEAFDAADCPLLNPETALDGAATLKLQPYLHLLEVHYPVDDLLLTVRHAKNGRLSSLRRQKLLAQVQRAPAYIAVHRAEFSVHYKRLEREAFLLLKDLQRRATLAEALETAFCESGVSQDAIGELIQSWFANWMELGWFCS